MNLILVFLLLTAALYGAAPTTVSVSPTSGSASSQVFTWVVSDTDGGTNITTVYSLINVTSTNTGACYVITNRSAGTMSLDGGNSGAAMTPGSGSTDEHSNCKVYMTGSSITTGATTVTAVINVEFKTAFAGAKNLYLAVSDATPTFVGFNDMGDFTATAPTSTNPCTKYTVPYTSVQTAATTNSVTLFTLPAQGKITGLTMKASTAFAGTSITAVTASVGKSGNTAVYAPAFNVLQTTGSTVMQDDGGHFSADFASHAVTATFTSTGANLSALTAGSVDIWACTVTLP